jgi:L-threonylcarbamoyladenylate synthase
MMDLGEFQDNCTDFMGTIGQDIEYAIQLLESGRLVAIPTETVYGLAGNALDQTAILEIYKAKNRPQFDPLIAHIGSYTMLEILVDHIPDHVRDLCEAFWPGPLTLLLDKSKHVPDILTSGLPRVAVRMPNHPLTLKLLGHLDFPLAAPSANPFGFVSPTQPHHVLDQMGDKIPYILDGGQTDIGIESTIISIQNDDIFVHRLGGLKVEELEPYGNIKLSINKSSNPVAPGQLKSHYSPGIPLLVGDVEQMIRSHSDKKIGVISFHQNYPEAITFALSPKKDLDEAAKQLFVALRSMRHKKVDIILCEKFPETGMGRAINDRLQRASITYNM